MSKIKERAEALKAKKLVQQHGEIKEDSSN